VTDTPPREFTGRDLVEALQQAARAFGVRRSDLGYETLAEGRGGVGLAHQCVIRAWPRVAAAVAPARPVEPPRLPRPERGMRDDRGRGPNPRSAGPRPEGRPPRRDDLPHAGRQQPPERTRGGMYDDSMPARLSDRPSGHRDDRRRPRPGRPEHGPRRPARGRDDRPSGRGPRDPREPRRHDQHADRPDRGRRRRPRPHPAQDAHAPDRPEREPTVPATETHAAEIHDLLEEIVAHWGLDLRVSARAQDDTIIASLDGPDDASLATDDGRVLEALQYLVSKMTSRILTDNVRVLLDAGGWRGSRDQALRDRALGVARDASENGRKLRLDPLNPYERRVVHLALKDVPGIRTYSIGRGYLKRVTIEPILAESSRDDSEE
jgi:spoIIIJ-associated protein